MAERIHPLLGRAIKGKDLARLFNLGGIVISLKDGAIGVIPGAEFEIEIQPPGSEEWTKIELPRWHPSHEGLTPGEQVIIAANFGRGQRGKKDRATWLRQNVTIETAAIRSGYSVVGGHRGGMRQANSPAALKVLFRRTPPRKYR